MKKQYDTIEMMTYLFCCAARLALPAIIAFLPLVASPALSQEADAEPRARRVVVGLYESPPFVFDTEGVPKGMAIDLWARLAADLDVSYDYREFETYRALIDATAEGEVDVAVSNLTITRNRAERVDFTQPWFDGGMRVMIDPGGDGGAGSFWNGLREAGHLRSYAWIVVAVVFGTLTLTMFDRHFDSKFPTRWRDGLAESFYSVMSIATAGNTPSRAHLFGWIGRIWQGLWLICGVAVLAFVTSSVTSVMTTPTLTRQINGVDDLSGRTVGILAGSVAEDYARIHRFAIRRYDGIAEAAEALSSGQISAVIADAPVLDYYTFTHPEAALTVVGPIFEPDKYGFALSPESSRAKRLTLGILAAHETGAIAELKQRYFGY